MEEQIEDLYQQALTIGIKYYEFWDMTVLEIIDAVKAYNKQLKMEYLKMYNNADMISAFTIGRLNGQKIQGFDELFPEFVDEKDRKEKEDMNNAYIASMFRAFAKQHNTNRNKRGGDGL